jgi:hypothetical protein
MGSTASPPSTRPRHQHVRRWHPSAMRAPPPLPQLHAQQTPHLGGCGTRAGRLARGSERATPRHICPRPGHAAAVPAGTCLLADKPVDLFSEVLLLQKACFLVLDDRSAGSSRRHLLVRQLIYFQRYYCHKITGFKTEIHTWDTWRAWP